VKSFGLVILFGLVAAVASFAQPAVPPAGESSTITTNPPLVVRLWLPKNAESLHAPAAVHIYARVTSLQSGHEGDKVQVDFFADAKAIGSSQSFWRAGKRPDPNSNRPQPMIVLLPGFAPTALTWSNAPAGTHVLTARATQNNGDTAISPPVSVTILP
jgi:hypothetical protein